MRIPEELFYTKEHEWIQAEDEAATVGNHRLCPTGARGHRFL